MLEKTREVPPLADATYVHTLVIKSTYIYSFTMQALSIHCILKFLDISGFLRHYLLNLIFPTQRIQCKCVCRSTMVDSI